MHFLEDGFFTIRMTNSKLEVDGDQIPTWTWKILDVYE